MDGSETTAIESRRRPFTWRWEYVYFMPLALFLTAFTIAFFYFSADVSQLKSYGYGGLFAVNAVGAASVFLPTPAGASVVGGGAFLNDFLGLPAFFWVGLVAGLGETAGEFTGYAAGYGGRIIVENRPEYRRIHGWMQRHGILTMFLMSIIPNPLFDLAGVAAGAVQMPIPRFFLAVLGGKVIKDLYLAAIGGLGAAIFTQLSG